MDHYKEKLKLQNRIIALCCAVLALFSLLAILGELELLPFMAPSAGDTHWQSQWRGFITGASMAIMGMMLFSLYRNQAALKDEAKLKKLYVKNHDERTIQIYTAARAAALQTFLLVGLAGIIIAGYFSATVSLTILACIWAASLLTLLFKVYFSRKF